jgi:hypothetical protein
MSRVPSNAASHGPERQIPGHSAIDQASLFPKKNANGIAGRIPDHRFVGHGQDDNICVNCAAGQASDGSRRSPRSAATGIGLHAVQTLLFDSSLSSSFLSNAWPLPRNSQTHEDAVSA